MGVQGLHTYILQHGGCLRRHRLRNCRLVIDGSNLAHHLYHLHRIDYMFGGEYEQYARELRRAFANLVLCGVQPLFVLDGAKDWSGPKLREQRSRLERRVRKCAQLKKSGGSGCGGDNDGGHNRLLPVLAMDVFIQCVVAEFNFPLTISPTGDADRHLASLGAQLGCPVLTNDSDFLIFDLPGGVVLTKTLHLTKALVDDSEAGDSCGPFLDCEIYRVNEFYLPALKQAAKPQLLPLCATLIGNDYLSKGAAVRCILSRVQLPKGGRAGQNSRHRIIAGVLAWTHRNFASPEDCLAALRRLLLGDEDEAASCEAVAADGKAWARRFLAAVQESLRHYRLDRSLELVPTALAGLGGGDGPRLRYAECLGLPDWLIRSGLLDGAVSTLFLDVAQHAKVFLPIGLEDVAEPNAFGDTADLRRLAYAAHLAGLGRLAEVPCVLEHHRRLAGLGKTPLSLPPSVADLEDQLPPHCGTGGIVGCVASRLGYPGDPLSDSVPNPGVRLLLYVVLASRRLLMTAAAVAPRTAASVCLTLLAVCLHRLSGRLRTAEATSEPEPEELDLQRRRVLAKYAEPPVINNRVKYDLQLVHCLSHFQATLLSAMLLVQAHRSYRQGGSAEAAAPTEQLQDLPAVSEFLSGRLVYNLAGDVESRKDGPLFLSELLVRRSSLALAFNCAVGLMSE